MRTVVEIFTGLGGLALGLERAGFTHLALVEWGKDACQTVRENYPDWPLYEGDVRDFSYEAIPKDVDLLAGGPPCQPFSLGGKHRGREDRRNMFPEVFRAQRELRPKAILIENVYGLTRPAFRPYFEYILLQLRFPFITLEPHEEWEEHKERLLEYAERIDDDKRGDDYDVTFRVINAADYGVPQIRKRVFIVGFRKDLGLRWSWELVAPSHLKEALEHAQWVDGSYWREHFLPLPTRCMPDKAVGEQRLQRWRTVRDALHGLPEPVDGAEYPGIANHVGIPGARVYPGHTGNMLDKPAKTVKAGDHGCPGGEHVLVKDDGSYRYLTVRECARLQGFPDTLRFTCSRTEAMRQLGNAVPIPVAEIFGAAISRVLGGEVVVNERPTATQVEFAWYPSRLAQMVSR
ncbi:hypothetical protein SY88_05005 [Clostridiales bacterium PH28_bin88]|nr:hypothetical protein SY88_05005 [Clostridiales bacterium PH28_bin88]